MNEYYFLNIVRILVTVCLWTITGCNTTASTERQLYQVIFQEDESAFRGVNIGDKVGKVKTLNDKVAPVYEDLLGLKYNYPAGKGNIHVNYYIDNLRTGKESNQVTAIALEIHWENEIETAQIYDEIHQKFIQKYGLPSGNYGDFFWENTGYQMEIRLKMSLEKKQILLFFTEKY